MPHLGVTCSEKRLKRKQTPAKGAKDAKDVNLVMEKDKALFLLIFGVIFWGRWKSLSPSHILSHQIVTLIPLFGLLSIAVGRRATCLT